MSKQGSMLTYIFYLLVDNKDLNLIPLSQIPEDSYQPTLLAIYEQSSILYLWSQGYHIYSKYESEAKTFQVIQILKDLILQYFDTHIHFTL